MSSGTGQGAVVSFQNVGTGNLNFNARARVVNTMQGRGREVLDFTDLERTVTMDMRPGDLLTPGTYELEFITDFDGTETNRPSAANLEALKLATNATMQMTIASLLDGSTMVAPGFVADSDGPDLETNVPMADRITWQVRGLVTWS